MKITASAAELTAALALAALALDDKIKVEILHAVHIEAADDVVRFTVNGGDRIIETFATVKVAEPGETVVAAAALVGLVAGFAKNVTIEIETDKKRAQIRCGRAIYRLPVMPLEQLPPAPTIDMVMGEAELTRQDLLTAIKRVKFAAEVDGTRCYLCGIYLHGTGDQLVAVATDGHRLAKCRIPASVLQDLAAIVPLATIEPIIKLLTRSKTVERVKLRRSRTLIEIAASGFTLTTKLVDGTYPDYGRLIPCRRPTARLSIAPISSPRWRGSPPSPRARRRSPRWRVSNGAPPSRPCVCRCQTRPAPPRTSSRRRSPAARRYGARSSSRT